MLCPPRRAFARLRLAPLIVSAVVVAGGAGLFAQPAGAYVVCDLKCPHEYMAHQALELISEADVKAHFNSIQAGITHEDEFDHIYGQNFAIPVIGLPYVTASHFWDADLGVNERAHNAEPFFPSAPNAWQKMRAMWSLALGRYAQGDKAMAYHYLGHVIHFFGDATVPAHDHDEPHGPEPLNDDAFHDWMDEEGSPPPNAGLKPGELNALKNGGMDSLPTGGPTQVPASEGDKLKWLFYYTVQIGDFFASDGTDGDSNAGGWDGDAAALTVVQNKLNAMKANPALSRLQDQDELDDNDNGDDNDDGDLRTIRDWSYLPGIQTMAAVYQLFNHAVANQLTLSVVIEHLDENEHDTEDHDEFDGPDYFADVVVNGLLSRNRGEQLEDKAIISPNWAFGSTVPLSGTVPVIINIWDHDGENDNITFNGGDDHSDISHVKGSRSLGLNVDIAKCMRKEAGSISGDQSGACGTTLQDEGDSDTDKFRTLIRYKIVASKSPPVADAGGPYTTNEGTDVDLDSSNSSDPDNDIVSRTWDLDGDGNCGEASGQVKPKFTKVGQDGKTTVKVCLTDALGLTAEDTAEVTVNNVEPAITLTAPILGPSENTSLTLPVITASDPGWAEDLSATIDWGDGTPKQALGGTLENVRPDATLTASPSHTYGDNGTYTVQVCAKDDDSEPCKSVSVPVSNTRPTVTIDLADTVSVNGVPTVLAKAGGSVPFKARSTDPGSDDLTLKWVWGDGTAATQRTSFVNPPNADPVNSASIQPRDVNDPVTHTFAGACAYETTFSSTDDDTGTASQKANVVIVATGTASRSASSWRQAIRNGTFSNERLGCFLKIVGYMSRVFDEKTDASTVAKISNILNANMFSSAAAQLDAQLLTLWLNFANGTLAYNRQVDTNQNGIPDTRLLTAMFDIESLRLDPKTPNATMVRHKYIVEGWNLLR